jgi:hypothetical protein
VRDTTYSSCSTTREESESSLQKSLGSRDFSCKKMGSPPKRQKVYDDKPITPIDEKRI